MRSPSRRHAAGRGIGFWSHLAIILVLALPVSFGASAQDPTGRAADIKTTLQRIYGTDPVDRAVAVQEALGSEDPVLRSFVLEKALASDDRRVRAVALTYLIGAQKRLVVEVTVPPTVLDQLKEAGPDGPQKAISLGRARTQEIIVKDYNKTTNQFSGLSGSLGPITGAVGQDGITIIYPYLFECKLQLSAASGGYLIGSFTMGSSSFIAKAALP